MDSIMIGEDFARKNAARFEKSIRHETPDRAPVAVNVNGPFVAVFAGIPYTKYYEDKELMMESQIKVRKRFYNLTTVWPDFGVALEASALGAEIHWGTDGTPWARPFIKSIEDVEKLRVPDPRRDGMFPKSLETFEYMRKNAEEDVRVSYCSCIGPVTLAALLRGATEFLQDLYMNKELVKKIIRVATETAKAWLKAQVEVAEDTKYVLVGDDMSSYLNPKQFKEFVLPSYQEIYSTFPKHQHWLHNDAKAGHLLELFADAGVEIFHIGYEDNLVDAKKRVGNRICFMGNLSPLGVLRDGTRDKVISSSRELIEKLAHHGGFVLAPGGYTAEGTPPENIDAMIETAENTPIPDSV